MKIYQSRYSKLTGSSYLELERKARKLYNEVAKRTKRNAYIRSKYFKKDKIFIKLFWEHLSQKKQGDRRRRLEYYQCALDALRNTDVKPEIKPNPNHKNEIVYRFFARTKEGSQFYIQVKQDKRGNKHFISVFPWK